jgi:hypothetical protein
MRTTCQKTSDGWPSKPELDAKLLEKVKQESASLLEIAQLLVQGASCNALDFLGRSVLHWAVQQDNFALGSLLIDFGASVDQVDNTNTLPLHVAAGFYFLFFSLFFFSFLFLQECVRVGSWPGC